MRLGFDRLNSQFEYFTPHEIAIILRDIADKIEAGNERGNIQDKSGKHVGCFDIWEDLRGDD